MNYYLWYTVNGSPYGTRKPGRNWVRYYLKRSQSHTGVPYVAVDRPTRRNHGYSDLKRHPEKIALIPELLDVPELLAFVKLLNSAASIFRSIGCEHSLGPSGDTINRFKFTSYVGVAFDVLAWNNFDNFEILFKHFKNFLESVEKPGPPTEKMSVEFEIHFATFNEHGGFRGNLLTVWNDGYGKTPEEARALWAESVLVVCAFFEAESAASKPSWVEGLTRISS